MVNENRPPTQSLPIQQDMTPPAPDPAVVSSGGSVVRLEIFLSPEQMHQMLRGIIHGAHTVMTVREAAQHLRIKQKTLLEMAEKGEIPAFCVEGEWKFPRHAVDEWIATQTLISENSKGKSKEKNHAI
ncbi:MAG: helix-turn-helix domain-containing protein [Candidatus Caldarchaeum sp.]